MRNQFGNFWCILGLHGLLMGLCRPTELVVYIYGSTLNVVRSTIKPSGPRQGSRCQHDAPHFLDENPGAPSPSLPTFIFLWFIWFFPSQSVQISLQLITRWASFNYYSLEIPFFFYFGSLNCLCFLVVDFECYVIVVCHQQCLRLFLFGEQKVFFIWQFNGFVHWYPVIKELLGPFFFIESWHMLFRCVVQ